MKERYTMYFDGFASKWDTQMTIKRAKILAHQISGSLPDTTLFLCIYQK